eukprot:TRINITY_DN1000_c0_g1_i4.p1 TRINITY_DN1000_c0_g1~~TRINITY_DN1000_c0_g1_i4.p1  ORF type:complete len:352 (-),score=51.86 TRINITY_DN1000_c0_g1_i4:1093-2148(-)
MSFSFFRLRPRTPVELIRHTRECLQAIRSPAREGVNGHGDGRGGGDGRANEKNLEIAKNLMAMKQILFGDGGETEPNLELSHQLTMEACKNDFFSLLIKRLHLLDFEARKDVALVFCSLVRQEINGRQIVLEYIEKSSDLLDLLLHGYEKPKTALNCGTMLRECARHPTLSKYMLESPSFKLFFKYVELPSFDIASDAFQTFKEFLTKHRPIVCNYLSLRYSEFFDLYDKLLSSENYVVRRQSLKLLGEILLDKTNIGVMIKYIGEPQNLRIVMNLLKDPSKNIQYEAFHVFKVFVANPNKPAKIVGILSKNREKLLKFLENFRVDREDEQFEEEKVLLMREIESLPAPSP